MNDPLGVGANGQPFAADDAVAEIAIKPGSRVGLTVEHQRATKAMPPCAERSVNALPRTPHPAA